MKSLKVAYLRDIQKAEVDIVPTLSNHIRALADTIRPKDREEIESYGWSVNKGLWKCFKGGLMNRTALINGRVAACWGVGGAYMGSRGAPWLITSYEVERISPLQFARIYKNEVKQMLEAFPVLENYVLWDYEEAIRMLKICGFKIGDMEAYGDGTYRKFSMARVE